MREKCVVTVCSVQCTRSHAHTQHINNEMVKVFHYRVAYYCYLCYRDVYLDI